MKDQNDGDGDVGRTRRCQVENVVILARFQLQIENLIKVNKLLLFLARFFLYDANIHTIFYLFL